MPTAGLIRMALAMPLHGILLLHALRSPVAREPSTIMACCALLRYAQSQLAAHAQGAQGQRAAHARIVRHPP